MQTQTFKLFIIFSWNNPPAQSLKEHIFLFLLKEHIFLFNKNISK